MKATTELILARGGGPRVRIRLPPAGSQLQTSLSGRIRLWDIVIKKQKPSGFFGTNLASYLTLLGCDSVIVVGTTTSGCVRATVVDAFSLNYRVILAEEGCFDRSEASHAVSLCDMHAKYADVLPMAEILSYFDQLPTDLFDLPTGSRSAAMPVREAAE
jgi:maleamate amidohydrolase